MLIKLIDIDYSQYFDEEAILRQYSYLPFYNQSLQYCKDKQIKMENFGITHFDWYADITKAELIEYFSAKYKQFARNNKEIR